jgi:membrane fusion protein (multidrug efflux system)
MKSSRILAIIPALIALCLPACQTHEEQPESKHRKIVVTSPMAKDVVITEPYVCQIHSKQHIKVKALQSGYLEKIHVKEGQPVKAKDVMFEILPTLYKAKLDTALAEAKLAALELKYTQQLAKQKMVSQSEVSLYEAKLARANFKAKQAEKELDFTKVRARFDGIIDRLHEQLGSLIKEGDVLTTPSDNSEMWVYFNVPERPYLEYKRGLKSGKGGWAKIELVLADGSKFKQAAISLRSEAQFNNETGNIAFRADYPNPDGLLRHGMTGTVLIHLPLKNAVVIPQRATFEVLDRRYVYVVGKDGKVQQRGIVVQNVLEDIFVIKKGLGVNDRIVFEGVQQVHDGEQVEEYEFRPPEQVLAHQKYHAE